MKSKPLNIRITETQDQNLRKLGGPTKGFELMHDFLVDNYEDFKKWKKEKEKSKKL